MKRTLLLIVSACLFSTLLRAQTIQVGVQGSAVFGRISGDGFSTRYSPGFQGGITSSVRISDRWSFGPEVQFSQLTALTGSLTHYYVTTARPNSDNKYVYLRYLNVPLLLHYKASKMLTLQAGIQGSYLFDADEHLRRDGDASFKKTDMSAVAGITLDITKRIQLTGRYVQGLYNINDNIVNSRHWQTQQMQFGIGYRVF